MNVTSSRVFSWWSIVCPCILGLLVFSMNTLDLYAAKVIEFRKSEASSNAPPMIAIIGAVNSPGTYQISGRSIPLQELIQQAGGLTEGAGNKVQIVRAGRAGIVLPRHAQTNYDCRPGDVVMIENAGPQRTKVVAFDPSERIHQTEGGSQVVRATHHQVRKQKFNYGHIVLIGLQEHPVVMPLWRSDLTGNELLTNWLKQPSSVAEQTKFVAGSRDRQNPAILKDGTVLQVPSKLVHGEDLPRLPSPIALAEIPPAAPQELAPVQPRPTTEPTPAKQEYQPTEPDHNKWLDERDRPTELEPVPFSQLDEDTTAPEHNFIPDTDEIPASSQGEEVTSMLPNAQQDSGVGLLTLPSIPAGVAVDETNFFNKIEVEDATHVPVATNDEGESAVPPSFEASLAGTTYIARNTTGEFETESRENIHLAAADEVIPTPIDPAEDNSSLSLIGLVAGGIVIIGVVTVIFASVRTHLTDTMHTNAEAQMEHPRTTRQTSPVMKDLAPVPSSQSSKVIEALSEDQIPTIEEKTLMPREMQFFGKPHLHYEFRIDAAHETRKPHIRIRPAEEVAQAENTSEETNQAPEPKIGRGPVSKIKKEQVQWEGQTAFEQINYQSFIQTTSNLR